MNSRKNWALLFGYLLLVAAALFVIIGRGNGRSSVEATMAIPLPTPPAIALESLDTLLPPDSIRAIDDPQLVPFNQAQDMALDERVIGIVINGEVRAYPLKILSSHEIVNDTVGGEPVAVTWCPLCYSALVFSRDVDGQLLTFGVSGKLLQNTLVMFDRDTGTFWSQLYGGAISGALSGRALNVFPSVLTTWEAWIAQNSAGQVLSKQLTCAQFDCGTYATNPRGSYAVDPYRSYYSSPDEGIVDRQIPRDELSARPKERVLGVRVGSSARAYPFKLLAEQRVINDEIEGVPVLIWFDPESQTGAAYGREMDGRLLSFEPDAEDPAFLRDIESGSRWVGSSGHGADARNRQNRLTALISTPAFEFGWYDYFPQSDTYSSDSYHNLRFGSITPSRV